MRRSTILWLSLMIFVLFVGANAAIIDESLQPQLDQVEPNETVQALVYFTHQADIPDLNKQLKLERSTLAERNRRVILALQNAATSTQAPVVSYLEDLKAQGLVEDYTMFWIANAFHVTATSAGIDAIAARQDLDVIFANPGIEGIEPVEINDAGGFSTTREIGLDRINAPAAWTQGWTGAGRVLMNIDTGVDGNHPALTERFLGDTNGNGTYEESWFDPWTSSYPFPTDDGGHGTHTMGTICGRTASGDTIGVAIDAQWIAAAAIDRGGGIPRTVADAILSFQWAVDPDGNPNTQDNPDAIGNSWGVTTGHGYPPCDQTFWQVIDNCEAAGSAVIFSAGNEGPSASSHRRPSDRGTTDYNCYSVGAVDGASQNLPIASFSSRGPSNCGPNGETVIKPEVVAPGVNVRSSIPGGGYSSYSGTSMASPHVTGAIGVIRGVNPDLDVDTIKEILIATAHDLGPSGEDNDYGHGVIDVFEACLVAQSGYGYVAGQVTDINNVGISNAYVDILNSPRFTLADANGDYFLGLPADTTYDMEASYFGYLPAQGTAATTPDDTTFVNFQLLAAPNGSVYGHVMSVVDSLPIEGASVEVADAPIDPVFTDANGDYTIPVIPSGSTYLLRVRASGFGIGQDSVFIPESGNPEVNFALLPFESFELDNGLWEGNGVWEWGEPLAGPPTAYDGTKVWGTALGGDYPNNADDTLFTRSYLVQEPTAIMSFYHWHNIESGWDGGNVAVSTDGGLTWNLIEPTSGYPDPNIVGLDNEPGFTGDSGDWVLVEFDMGNYNGETVKFHLRFGTDGSVTRTGWFIDAFVFSGAEIVYEGSPEISLNPTSFHVTLTQGTSTTDILGISNLGDALLGYTLSTTVNPTFVAEPIYIEDPMYLDPNWGKNLNREYDGNLVITTYTGPKMEHENLPTPPMTTDFGGPDAFGYVWYDSNEPNGPVFDWIDITSIGQPLEFLDDQNQGPFDLGFMMPFYDNNFSTFNICSNGWISFTSTSTSLSNTAIPNGAVPNNLIAPFWDDLDPGNDPIMPRLFYYTNNADTAIVMWDHVPHYPNDGSNTFQIIMTAEGTITFQYLELIGDMDQHTIGIENGDGTIGLQVAFDQLYVTDGLAILFAYPVQWLSADPLQGTVDPSGTDDITVTFNATELDGGEYYGGIIVNSNDPAFPQIVVPCTLTVAPLGVPGETTGIIPVAFSLDQNYPNPFNPTTEISFGLPLNSNVELTIFDVLGRQVKSLVSNDMEAGYHTITWDGKDRSGNEVTSGVYFYTLKAGDYEQTQKMIMLK